MAAIDKTKWNYVELQTTKLTGLLDGATNYFVIRNEKHVAFKAQEMDPDVRVTSGKCIASREISTSVPTCFSVSVHGLNSAKVVTLESTGGNKSWNEGAPEPSTYEDARTRHQLVAGISLHYRDEETAKRVAKAIAHAIELSRAQYPEPF